MKNKFNKTWVQIIEKIFRMAEKGSKAKVPTSGYTLFVSEANQHPDILETAEKQIRKEMKNENEKISQFKIYSQAWN